MKHLTRILFAVALFFVFAASPSRSAFAQQSPSRAGTPSQAELDRIIRAFTEKETQFRTALNQYGFRREAVIQTIGMGGQVTGEYNRVSQFVFDDSGNRFEKIVFFPIPTLSEINLTPADLEDLGGVQTYALEVAKINQYNFTYAGKERIDEIDLYVFDVAPKVMPDPRKSKERFFQGRIWVDDRDLQIVKVRGKGVPEGKERFPTFETYREQVDGRYWFPTYTYADDQLVFPSGQVVRMRMRVRYTDYVRLRGRVRVIEDDEPPPTTTPPAQPTPSPTNRRP